MIHAHPWRHGKFDVCTSYTNNAMLSSLGHFDSFYCTETGRLQSDSAGGRVTVGSRKCAQRQRSRGLGIAEKPVFRAAMDKLRAAGLSPRYVELKGLVDRLPWAEMPPAVSPAGGLVPEVGDTRSRRHLLLSLCFN